MDISRRHLKCADGYESEILITFAHKAAKIRLFFLVKLVNKTLVYSQQMESAGTLKTTDRHP